MPLSNDEFARLDAARVNSRHHRQTGDSKRILQLAFEHIEDFHDQQRRAILTIEELVKLRNKSWCFRVPRFFKYWTARIALWLR